MTTLDILKAVQTQISKIWLGIFGRMHKEVVTAHVWRLG